jgi:hypothetical protein
MIRESIGGARGAMEADMRNRVFWVSASVCVGLLQAWDSTALSSGAVPALLTIAGMTAPVVTIALRVHHGVRVAALIAGALLLLAARMAAPTALNALHLALFPPALYILFVKGLLPDARDQAA